MNRDRDRRASLDDGRHMGLRSRWRVVTLGASAALVALIALVAVLARSGSDGAPGGRGEPDASAPTTLVVAGRGPTTVQVDDGTTLGRLPRPGAASSGDPAIERVLAELLDDPPVSGRLAELGVQGDRVGRARLLGSARLVVHTSIDRNAQAAATSAAAAVVAPGRVGAAIVAMEQTTGRIVALHGPVDVARQAGGAFLPFTMAAALEAGVSATEPLAAAHPTAPPGSSESAGGDAEDASDQSASITDALVRSANVPWLQLVRDGRLSAKAVMKLAQRAGVVDYDDASPAAPSSILGANSMTPLRLASGYAMVAAGGVRAVPHVIDRIEGPNGRAIYAAAPRDEPVVTASIAAQLRAAMQQVVCCGTGQEAELGDGYPQFGKTGTSQDFRDAWFAGATPRLTAVVWVGVPGRPEPLVPPLTPETVSGRTWPARIWKLFVQGALPGEDRGAFPDPARASRPVDSGSRRPHRAG